MHRRANMASKKITKSGAITIPADMRRSVNLFPGDAVDIEEKDGKIVISAHINRCFVCRSEVDVVVYKGKAFCKSCIKALGGMING